MSQIEDEQIKDAIAMAQAECVQAIDALKKLRDHLDDLTRRHEVSMVLSWLYEVLGEVRQPKVNLLREVDDIE